MVITYCCNNAAKYNKVIAFLQRIWYTFLRGEIMSEIGDYLRNARNERGLSQAKVHTQVGITNSRLSKAENGADNILSAAELKKLAILYGVPVVPMFIMAGFLDTSDLEEYRSGFKNTAMLDSYEKSHIQDEIDFIIKKKG